MSLNPHVEYCDTKCFQRLPKYAEFVATAVSIRSRLGQVLADEHGAVEVQNTQPYAPQFLWYELKRALRCKKQTCKSEHLKKKKKKPNTVQYAD